MTPHDVFSAYSYINKKTYDLQMVFDLELGCASIELQTPCNQNNTL